MPAHLNSHQFKTMPWKNGGGETIELFRLENPQDPSQFVFRLSHAFVRSDGPFSSFPGIDRILLLLEGNGCTLKFPDREVKLLQKLVPFSFEGEEEIYCRLTHGELQDFNVMVDRNWGTGHVEVLESGGNLACLEDYLFIYRPKLKTLDVLTRGETIELKDPDQKKIVIRIRKTI